ncbi:MAG: ATP synthase subunit I, partial [Syntrophaceae bacterium]|nr:ATP synthase subunit I [Syntrophaceae bacterium]
MNPIVKDPLQKKIELSNWIILAVILIPSLIFAPVKFSLGILLGGFISILNFHWMEKGLRGLFQKTG